MKALEYVKKLREAGAEEVVLVHVIDVPDLSLIHISEPTRPY